MGETSIERPMINPFGDDGHVRPLKAILSEVIDVAMIYCPDKKKAAQQLGLGRSTLYRKLSSGERVT